jgi:pimeloyl-[acyl-carrier protein] methyl ester esterase
MSGALHVVSSGHGPPLALLHGWAMHSGIWGGLAAQLAERHRVHAVDLPGHGFSAPVPSFTIDGVVRLLDAAFAAERSPIVVVGWSLGGLIAGMVAVASGTGRAPVLVSAPRFAAETDGLRCRRDTALRRRARRRMESDGPALSTLQMRGGGHGRVALRCAAASARGEPSRRTLAQRFWCWRRRTFAGGR